MMRRVRRSFSFSSIVVDYPRGNSVSALSRSWLTAHPGKAEDVNAEPEADEACEAPGEADNECSCEEIDKVVEIHVLSPFSFSLEPVREIGR
jgi:hypothetical protein